MPCTQESIAKCEIRNQFCNPESGRCVSTDGPSARRFLGKHGVCSEVKQRECKHEDKICNPERHQCVVPHGSRGKKLLSNAHYLDHHDVSHVAPYVWTSVARSALHGHENNDEHEPSIDTHHRHHENNDDEYEHEHPYYSMSTPSIDTHHRHRPHSRHHHHASSIGTHYYPQSIGTHYPHASSIGGTHSRHHHHTYPATTTTTSASVDMPSEDVERATVDALSKLGDYQRLDEQEQHHLEQNVRDGHRRGVMNRLFGSARSAMAGMWQLTKKYPAFSVLVLAALLLGVHARVDDRTTALVVGALEKLGSFPGVASAKLFFQKYWPWAVKTVTDKVPPTSIGIFGRIGAFLAKSRTLLWTAPTTTAVGGHAGTWSIASKYATAKWKSAVVAASFAFQHILAFLKRYFGAYASALKSTETSDMPSSRWFRLY